MTQSNDPEQADPPFFSAVLTPHRSLTPTGFVWVMGLVAAISFAGGLIFWLKGAWPIVGFFGLDVALVYLAFKANYRSGRAFEVIEVSRSLLAIDKVDPRGRSRSFRLNPYWSRLEVERSVAWGITAMRVAAKGQTVPFGQFLTPDERESFARAFDAALAEARALPQG